jgi:hypothetical protein
MKTITLKGEIVLKWLEKWPDLPKKQLARMIYNSDNNHLVFADQENVRRLIRTYRGQNGNRHRKYTRIKKFYDKQIQST